MVREAYAFCAVWGEIVEFATQGENLILSELENCRDILRF